MGSTYSSNAMGKIITRPQTVWSRDKLLSPSSHRYMYSIAPPSASQLLSTIEDFGLSSRIYRAPYYSDEKDAPPRPREYAGLVYNLKGGEGITHLDDWVSDCDANDSEQVTSAVETDSDIGGWEYAGSPPSVKEVRKWLRSPEGQLKSVAISKFSSRTQACIVVFFLF